MSDVTDFASLLKRAVSEPGQIARGYSLFWNYSLSNQMLALIESARRGIDPGPIATFVRWKSLGRYVKKGEKAFTLCMPVTVKRKTISGAAPVDGKSSDEAECFTRFVYRARWFMLAQTEGAEFKKPEPPPAWDEERALVTLGIKRVSFDMTNGNVQGFARAKSVAISPLAQNPLKTLLHEMAHVCLGHTEEANHADSELTPRSLKEVEAESVALLCLESLDMPGANYCRGYVQKWLDGDSIPERSAQRIYRAATSILEAGRATEAD